MRTAAVIFVVLHGFGHIIWFLSTWARPPLGEEGREQLDARREYFLVEPSTASGHVMGFLAIAVLVGFGVAAWGIAAQSSWWPPVLVASIVTSMVVNLAIWNPVMSVSVRAVLANLALGSALLMPWGDRFLGTR